MFIYGDQIASWKKSSIYNDLAVLEDELGEKLKDIFSLTPLNSIPKVLDSDLALDVVITHLNSGEFNSIDTGFFPIPILMRPKVRIK